MDESRKNALAEGVESIRPLDPADWIGETVVLDLASPFVAIGTLQGFSSVWVELTNVDLHDLRDTKTSRELYVLEARKHGIRVNRKSLLVHLREVVGLSRMKDVQE